MWRPWSIPVPLAAAAGLAVAVGVVCAGPGDEPAAAPRRLPARLEPVKSAPWAPLTGLAEGSAEAQAAQRKAVTELGWPLAVQTRQTGIVFRLVPAGEFGMGSPPSEAGRNNDETPHRVKLTRPFYCGAHEVTQGQWQQVMGVNPAAAKHAGKDAPVESVSWDDCQAFIKALAKLEGLPEGGCRLLTEAEWEYACRAGTTGPYAGAPNDLAWHSGNSRRTTHVVGDKSPNAWGLYDFHGNVWEWCADWYGDYPPEDATDPPGPLPAVSVAQARRVVRGGSYLNALSRCRSACRGNATPGHALNNYGLRLCLPLEAAP